jgi:hypothetical protein
MVASAQLWTVTRDGDSSVMDIFRRHYSYNIRRNQLKLWPNASDALVAGPGEKLVLKTPCGRAIFVWRKFKSDNGQQGVNCAVFRNEGAGVASELIRAADAIAWSRWPGHRLYTYVNPRKIKRSRQPGRCFLKAGWRYMLDANKKRALTKRRRLLILEHLPEEHPQLHDPGAQVLNILIAANGAGIDRDQIDAQTDYKRSSRDAYLQRLAARKLVEPAGRGAVRASEVLFE